MSIQLCGHNILECRRFLQRERRDTGLTPQGSPFSGCCPRSLGRQSQAAYLLGAPVMIAYGVDFSSFPGQPMHRLQGLSYRGRYGSDMVPRSRSGATPHVAADKHDTQQLIVGAKPATQPTSQKYQILMMKQHWQPLLC